ASVQEPNQPVAHLYWHCGVGKSGLAGKRLGFVTRGFGQFLLELKTGGAGAAFCGEHPAERVLAALSMMGKLPRFNSAQRNGQTGRFEEGSLVFLVNPGLAESLDHVAVAVVHLITFCCCSDDKIN